MLLLTAIKHFSVGEMRKGKTQYFIEVKELNFGADLSFCCFLRFDEIKEGDVVRHDGKRSDGYLEHIFKHAAKELFGMDVKEITYKALK